METTCTDDVCVTPETLLQSQSQSGSVDGIEIQCVGVLFNYTIPSLKCVRFTHRQKAVVNGNLNTYHGFIRHDPCLEIDLQYLRTIDVLESCFVKL